MVYAIPFFVMKHKINGVTYFTVVVTKISYQNGERIKRVSFNLYECKAQEVIYKYPIYAN